MEEMMYYFGYYIQFGCPCSVKWTGDIGDRIGPGVGGAIHDIVQVHELTEGQFRYSLVHLAFIYPFKDLPKLR